jgi:hypothetical protein
MGRNNSEVSLNLKRFDLRRIRDDSTCVFIGRRRTGKSFCLRELMYHNRDIPFGTVISATEDASPFFHKFVPKTYIFTEFQEHIVENLIDRQKALLNKQKTNEKFKNLDNRVFIILDDCLYDDSWAKTKPIRNIFMNGRHFKIFFMITMQYPLGMPPALRTNIDYTIIMREPYIKNRKIIYENYAGMFPDFNMFCQVMDSLEKHECLVISNNSDSSRFEDQVFWYKAEDHGDFQVGCEAFWRFHEQNYIDEENEEDQEPQSVTNKYKKKNLIKVNVNKEY